MLKLKAWNVALEYANEVCKDLLEKGYDVKPEPYIMYDNRKGIYLQVYDSNNNVYVKFATGIHETLVDMMEAIDRQGMKIINEC